MAPDTGMVCRDEAAQWLTNTGNALNFLARWGTLRPHRASIPRDTSGVARTHLVPCVGDQAPAG
jgi:hypothetical protein